MNKIIFKAKNEVAQNHGFADWENIECSEMSEEERNELKAMLVEEVAEKVLHTKDLNNEVQRRHNIERFVPAELEIFNAMQEVEKVGADVKLTQAVQKLSEAKDLVSDYIDKPKRKLIIFVCTECGYACILSEKDTEMINFMRSKVTHQHLKLGTRCIYPLAEMTGEEYVGSEAFYKQFENAE